MGHDKRPAGQVDLPGSPDHVRHRLLPRESLHPGVTQGDREHPGAELLPPQVGCLRIMVGGVHMKLFQSWNYSTSGNHCGHI